VGVVGELNAVREADADACDVGVAGIDLPAAAESVPAPAPTQVHPRRRGREVAAAGGAGDPPCGPAGGEAVDAGEQCHRRMAAPLVVGLECDDVELPAEDLPLLEELDRREI